VAKKKVTMTAASVSSKEAFPMARLALQLEVPTAVANIPGPMVREEYWNSGLDGRLEKVVARIHLDVMVASIHLQAVVVATSKSAWLQETLLTASQVGPV
jgi:hypothetical protein